MLVLTREAGSSVLIGDHVIVTVEALALDVATLRVTCPPELAVQVAGPRPDGHRTPVPHGDLDADGPPPAGTSRTRAVLGPDQTLAIGPDIIVTVERVYNAGGHQPRARLGFRAPRELPIVRQEISRRPAAPPAPAPPFAPPAGAAAPMGQPELPA